MLRFVRTRYSNHGLTINNVHRILCYCNITRIVTRGASEVVDIGRKTRNVPVALATITRSASREFGGDLREPVGISPTRLAATKRL